MHRNFLHAPDEVKRGRHPPPGWAVRQEFDLALGVLLVSRPVDVGDRRSAARVRDRNPSPVLHVGRARRLDGQPYAVPEISVGTRLERSNRLRTERVVDSRRSIIGTSISMCPAPNGYVRRSVRCMLSAPCSMNVRTAGSTSSGKRSATQTS